MRMYDEGRTLTDISQALGKSVSAIQAKKWRLEGGDPKAKAHESNLRGLDRATNRRGGQGTGGGGRGGSAGGITL